MPAEMTLTTENQANYNYFYESYHELCFINNHHKRWCEIKIVARKWRMWLFFLIPSEQLFFGMFFTKCCGYLESFIDHNYHTCPAPSHPHTRCLLLAWQCHLLLQTASVAYLWWLAFLPCASISSYWHKWQKQNPKSFNYRILTRPSGILTAGKRAFFHQLCCGFLQHTHLNRCWTTCAAFLNNGSRRCVWTIW